jgi:hypothetical protein
LLLDLRSLFEVSGSASLTPETGELKAVGEQALRIAGPLVLTGYAPELVVGTIQPVSVGALALAGLDPTLSLGIFLAPSVGVLALAGELPTIGGAEDTAIMPAAGALALAGVASTVSVITFLTPSVGALALAGIEPTILVATFLTPDAGAVALAGQAPTLGGAEAEDTAITTAVGALALAGVTPAVSVATVLIPATGAIATPSDAAGISSGSVLTPGTGQLSLSLLGGQTPVAITPDAGGLALSGHAPSVSGGGDLGPIPMRRIATKGIRWIKVGIARPEPTTIEVPVAYENTALTPDAGVIAAAGATAEIVSTRVATPVPVPALEPDEDIATIGGVIVAAVPDVLVVRRRTVRPVALTPAAAVLAATGQPARMVAGTEGLDWLRRQLDEMDEEFVMTGSLV